MTQTTRPVWFTLVGIVAIGYTLAILAPAQWQLGELILAAACIVLLRERKILLDHVPEPQPSTQSFSASTAGWFAGSAPYVPSGGPRVFHAREFEPAASSRPTPSAATGRSVEQIAHEMLAQAFRQASLKYHPDHGGDPEDMRRVYAAREMMLRAIRRA